MINVCCKMHLENLFSNIYMLLLIHRPHGILAAVFSINQNITGFVGNKDNHLTCSFLLEKGKQIFSIQIIAKNITEDFGDKKPIATFKPEEAAKLQTPGKYLFGRVSLTNITTTSTNATLTFNMLKCTDEKDYICVFYYNDVDDVLYRKKSKSTRILVQENPSRPDNISSVIVSSKPDKDDGNNASHFIRSIYNSSLKIKHNDHFTFRKSQIDTTISAQLQSTVKPSRFLHEGDTIIFTCTGNIGKPPGKLIWQKTSPQQERPITYYNETTKIEEISGRCAFTGTTNLTVDISAEHLNAKYRCFEESQADVPGMFVETMPLDVHFHVRNMTITKHPNKIQYDRRTAKITLTCKGSGNPNPTYKWFREENTNSVLAWKNVYDIEDVKQNNSGVYICKAYNSIDDIEYNATYSVKIDIVDELLSPTESESSKVSTVHAIIICAVVIVALVVIILCYNRLKRNKKEENCCQKLMDCLMSCYGTNVNQGTNNAVPLTELKRTSDGNKESKGNCRSSEEDKNLVETVDINAQLETNSIYADPCDTIKRGHVSDKPDLDFSYAV